MLESAGCIPVFPQKQYTEYKTRIGLPNGLPTQYLIILYSRILLKEPNFVLTDGRYVCLCDFIVISFMMCLGHVFKIDCLKICYMRIIFLSLFEIKVNAFYISLE